MEPTICDSRVQRNDMDINIKSLPPKSFKKKLKIDFIEKY